MSEECKHFWSGNTYGLQECLFCQATRPAPKPVPPLVDISTPPQEPVGELMARIQNYLGNGGLFNPEAMEHDKVRKLILDCREYIEDTRHTQGKVLVETELLRRAAQEIISLEDFWLRSGLPEDAKKVVQLHADLLRAVEGRS